MSNKWQGAGWYVFEQWNTDQEWFAWPENMSDAIWVEDEYDFKAFSEVSNGFESVVTYYGNDDIPSDDMRINEYYR